MTEDKKLCVGIVGCGTIADIHAQAIRQSDHLLIQSFYSRGEPRAKAAGNKYGAKWTTDWKDFIEDAQLDVVSICTPSGNHMDYGIKAAEAGKHVIVEKPIEVTMERAKQLIDKCNEQGVRLAIIYQSRFTPSIIWLKQQLEQQVIGKSFMGDATVKWFRTQDYYDSGEWRGTLNLDGGGVFINQAIHTIDLLQWLMGGVKTVFGQTGTFTHERLDGEDTAVAVLRYKNGSIGMIEGSTSILPAQARRIEIHGIKGTAVLDGDAVEIRIGEDIIHPPSAEQKKKVASGSSSPLAGFSIEPHRHQFEAIAEAINKDQDPPVTGRDSLDSLAIVLAVYESAKTGVAVNLDDFMR